MIQIKVDVRGLEAVRAQVAGMGKQVAFAASRALNETAKRVAEAMPAEIERAIDRPTPFTKRGVRVLKRANKTNLAATVGFMDAQARYMRWQIEGGTRQPGSRGLKLPASIKVDQYGNIPKGLIAQLIAVASKERKLGKVKARRIRVSAQVELFYGDPADHGGRSFPRGIYKRVGDGAAGRLIPLIVFPVTAARYKPRLDFRRKAEAVVAREWDPQFGRALGDAMRTAR